MTAVLTRQTSELVTTMGAASVAIRSLMLGPTRPVAVLAAFPSAIYLSTGDGTVAALVTGEAVRLPCAVVVGADTPDLGAVTGLIGESGSLNGSAGGRSIDAAAVGSGRVTVGHLRVEVER